MTEERLAQIEARAAAATPGPFDWYILSRAGRGHGVGRKTPGGHDEGICEDPYMLEGDAVFFAHARSDVPDLVAEVKRLRSELAAVRAAIGEAWVKAAPTLADAVAMKTRALEKLDEAAP